MALISDHDQTASSDHHASWTMKLSRTRPTPPEGAHEAGARTHGLSSALQIKHLHAVVGLIRYKELIVVNRHVIGIAELAIASAAAADKHRLGVEGVALATIASRLVERDAMVA